MPIKLISIGPDQEACINILSEVTKKTKEECRVYADLVNSGNNLSLTISRPYSNKKAVELLENLGCTAVAVNSTNGTKNVDKHGIDNKETNNKKTDNSETDSTKTSRKKTGNSESDDKKAAKESKKTMPDSKIETTTLHLCGKCRKPFAVELVDKIISVKCPHCNFTQVYNPVHPDIYIDQETNEEILGPAIQAFTSKDRLHNINIRCSNSECQKSLYIPEEPNKVAFLCPCCNTVSISRPSGQVFENYIELATNELIPGPAIQGLAKKEKPYTTSVICSNNKCKKTVYIPKNDKKVPLVCPYCSTVSIYIPVKIKMKQMFSETQQPVSAIQPNPSGKPFCGNRWVTICRLFHAHKDLSLHGISNAIKDAGVVTLYVDNEPIQLDKEDLRFQIDGGRHDISVGIFGGHFYLPEGSDSYCGYFFENRLFFGIENDLFADALVDYLIEVFRGKGIIERINEAAAIGRYVTLRINSDSIIIANPVAKSSNFIEWATGTRDEKITFNQLGLTPPPANILRSGYWEYINECVADAISRDKNTDIVVSSIGRVSIRERHDLF